MMHAGLVSVLLSILKDVGVIDMAVEAIGLIAADAYRPRDVVVLDFFVEGRHLDVDAVVMTVYRNTVLKHAQILNPSSCTILKYLAMLQNKPKT